MMASIRRPIMYALRAGSHLRGHSRARSDISAASGARLFCSSVPPNQRPGRQQRPTVASLKKKTEHALGQSSKPLVLQQLLYQWLQLTSEMHRKRDARLPTSVESVDVLAHRILDRLADDNRKQDLTPLIVQTKEVVRLWAKVGNGAKAERLFQRLQELRQNSSPIIRDAHDAVIVAFVRDQTCKDFLARALYWFGEFENPPLVAYNNMLNAYRRAGQTEGANELFQKMRSDQVKINPDVFSYSSLMNVWVASGKKEAQERIEELLLDLKGTYESRGCPAYLAPNAFIFGTAMTLAPPERAEALLSEMKLWYDRTGDDSLAPETRYYLTVMQKWASVGQPKATERLLVDLQKLCDDGYKKAIPTFKCFVTVMDAYVKRRTVSGVKDAERILSQMDQRLPPRELNNYPFNIVMDGYSRTSSNGSHTEAIFDRLVTLSQENPRMKPDKFSYTALMRAHVNARSDGWMQRVYAMLDEMEQNSGIKPDVVTYGFVINAIARSGDAAACAEGELMLDRMRKQGVPPNRICYNSVMHCFATHGDAASAKSILDEMKRGAERGNALVRPNAKDFAVCIDAHAKSRKAGSFEKASQLFVESYEYNKREFQSGAKIISSLMVALSADKVANKAEVAKAIFEQASTMAIAQTRPSYNSLLKAMATESGTSQAKHAALELSMSTFQELQNGPLGVDPITYRSVMTCCHELIDDASEQSAAIEEIFVLCCEDGFVTGAILSQYSDSCPDSALLADASNREGGDGNQLPADWTRKLSSKDRRFTQEIADRKAATENHS